MSGAAEERRRQRNIFLLMILAAVAAIYGLWGLSQLVAPDRDTPAPRPSDAISRLEADLDVAERLAADGRSEKAAEFIERVESRLGEMPPKGLRPAQALRLDSVRHRLAELRKQLDVPPDALWEGAGHGASGGA